MKQLPEKMCNFSSFVSSVCHGAQLIRLETNARALHSNAICGRLAQLRRVKVQLFHFLSVPYECGHCVSFPSKKNCLLLEIYFETKFRE
jgi:hypothetical protein